MGQINQLSGNKMGVVKTIDMRAHGTQKLRQKLCAHTKQKHKHMASKRESLAMCKTGHEHAANKETHKPRVHTKHDNHESTQPVKNKSCMPRRTRQNKRRQNEDNKCTQTEERTARANSRPHASTARPNLEHACPNPNTKPELGLKQDKSPGIRTPRSNMKQSA